MSYFLLLSGLFGPCDTLLSLSLFSILSVFVKPSPDLELTPRIDLDPPALSVILSPCRFGMLSLEFDYMCQYDYVEVRDGDNSDSPIIKRFCGNERPAPIRSTGSSLHVLFHSDGSKNFDGFHAVFEEITGKEHRDKFSHG